MPSASPVTVHPLEPGRLADFEALFGPKGACYGCWCTYFRMRPKERQVSTPEARHDHMADRIRRGPPPGLLAYRGERPVGWMQIGPRADVPEWNNPGRATTPLPDAPADDPSVWAISCFYFAPAERGRGLSHRLVAEGIAFARKQGARLIEAAPMDRAKQSGSVGLFVGSTSVFLKAGFSEVACHKPGRPLLRLTL